MTITKLKVYRDGKLFKHSKIGNFSPEGGILPIDFNDTKDPKKGFWVNIFKDENKPIFKSLKKEVEFTWEGNWTTDFKKDKDTKCTCIKKEKFHFRLVFENKSDYDKVVEFFEKEIKRKPKPKTKRKRLSKKKKKTQNGGKKIKKKRSGNKRKNNKKEKKTKKESRKSNEKFKEELKKCEKKCKNDDKFKQELKDELEKLDRPELKKMKKGFFLKSCSTKCLNDQGLYYDLQLLLKKNGGKSKQKKKKRTENKRRITKKRNKKAKKEKSHDKEDCSKVEKYFKEINR